MSTPQGPGVRRVGVIVVSAVLLTSLGLPTATADANRAPLAVDNEYHVHQGTTIRIGAPGILGNDRDADGDPLHVVRATGGTGALKISADGSLQYSATERFDGSDRWQVTIADSSGAEDVESVTFLLQNTRPVARANAYAVAQNGTLTQPAAKGVLGNDSDADGDPLEAHPLSSPEHGSLRLERDGGFQYIPDPGFAGTDEFAYTADDGGKDSRPATVTITVVAPNVAPVGVRDEYGTATGRSLVIGAPGVLANDRDGNRDPLNARLSSGVTHGILSLSEDGSFGYVPAEGFEGRDSFLYQAVDVDGETSAPTVVTITVGSANQDAVVTVSSPQAGTVAVPLEAPRMSLHLATHRERPSRRVTVAATVHTGKRTEGTTRVVHVAPRGTRLLSTTTPAGWTCWTNGRTTKCRVEDMARGTTARIAFRLALLTNAAMHSRSTVKAVFEGAGFTRKRTTQRVGW